MVFYMVGIREQELLQLTVVELHPEKEKLYGMDNWWRVADLVVRTLQLLQMQMVG